jgi:hypothetical protein
LLAPNLEHLVRVPGRAGPNLELDSVDVTAVGHVETLVAERRDGTSKGCKGSHPGEVGVGEVGTGVADAASDEDYLGAVSV